jgi:hypothetical protein
MMFHPTLSNCRKLKGIEPLSLESYLSASLGTDLGQQTLHTRSPFSCRSTVLPARKDDSYDETEDLGQSLSLAPLDDKNKSWIASEEETDDSDCRLRDVGSGGHRPSLGPIDLTNKPNTNLERLKQQKPAQRAGARLTSGGMLAENKGLSEAVLKRRRLAANARERKAASTCLLLTYFLLSALDGEIHEQFLTERYSRTIFIKTFSWPNHFLIYFFGRDQLINTWSTVFLGEEWTC